MSHLVPYRWFRVNWSGPQVKDSSSHELSCTLVCFSLYYSRCLFDSISSPINLCRRFSYQRLMRSTIFFTVFYLKQNTFHITWQKIYWAILFCIKIKPIINVRSEVRMKKILSWRSSLMNYQCSSWNSFLSFLHLCWKVKAWHIFGWL